MTSDLEYYERRALAERTVAAAASLPDVAAIHRRMQQEYEAMAARLRAAGVEDEDELEHDGSSTH